MFAGVGRSGDREEEVSPCGVARRREWRARRKWVGGGGLETARKVGSLRQQSYLEAVARRERRDTLRRAPPTLHCGYLCCHKHAAGHAIYLRLPENKTGSCPKPCMVPFKSGFSSGSRTLPRFARLVAWLVARTQASTTATQAAPLRTILPVVKPGPRQGGTLPPPRPPGSRVRSASRPLQLSPNFLQLSFCFLLLPGGCARESRG